MLTKSQIAQYRADGYTIPNFQMPDSALEAIQLRHASLLKDYPEFYDYCPSLMQYDERFADFCRNDEILDLVAQLIGPDIALWNSSFFAKPALSGKATPWHQDGQYWPIRPLATCSVWLAIDESNIQNGCLKVIKGSHKDESLKKHITNTSKKLTLNQEIIKTEFDESQAVDLVLKRGQISLHDVFLVHGSEANKSKNPRRGMTMRFMPTTSVYDRKLGRETYNMKFPQNAERKIYHMRGRDRSGLNNLIYL